MKWGKVLSGGVPQRKEGDCDCDFDFDFDFD